MNAAFKEVRAVKVLGRLGAVGLVCGVGLLTGCSSGEPETADPTPAVVEPSEATESVEPSPEPTAEESEEQHVAAAKQLVQEYIEATWALANDGYKDLGSMARFWGTPQLAESMSGVLLTAYESGRYSEGVGEIVSQTVTEYDTARPENPVFTLYLTQPRACQPPLELGHLYPAYRPCSARPFRWEACF